MSGDGNMHMQSKLRAKGLFYDPCRFGAFGFFVPQKLFAEYTEESTRLFKKPNAKVLTSCEQNLKVKFSRMPSVGQRQVVKIRSRQTSISVKEEFMQFNANTPYTDKTEFPT